MIRCAIPRSSSTAKWLATVNRSYAKSTLNSAEQNGSSTTNESAPEVAIAEEGEGTGDVKDAFIISNGSLDGKLGSKSYKPRDLPLSPLMNPEAIGAREKHHLPKLPPSKNPTLFQQQLAKNPYAQALTTPVRMCQITKIPLPSYFLQDFQLMAHPETKEPWWVPTSLRKKHEDGKAIEGNGEVGANPSAIPEQDSTLPFQSDSSPNPPLESMPPSESRPAPPSNTARLGPGTYLFSRQALISAMQNIKSGWGPNCHKNFFSGSIVRSLIARKVRERASWRTDMDTFILELMRRRIVEGLAYLVRRQRGYVAGCVDWEDVKLASRQQGAILWTGGSGGDSGGDEADVNSTSELEPGESRSKEQGSEHHGPPGFATLTVGKSKPHMVPVHNLVMLLGPEHVAELRKECPIFEKEVLTVKNKRNTVDIQMKLWSLQGYLGFPEPEYDKDFQERWKLGRKRLNSAVREENLERDTQRWHGIEDDETEDRSQRKKKSETKELGSVVGEECFEAETQGIAPSNGY